VLTKAQLLMHFPTFKSTFKGMFGGDGDSPLFLYDNDKGDRTEDPKLPEMSYGKPVDVNLQIYTAQLPAILLFQGGGVARLAPYQYGFIKYLESNPNYYHPPEYWDF